jgi:hypothetical protein
VQPVERQRVTFATPIPEVMPATVPPPWVPPAESESTIDPSVWEGPPSEGLPTPGEIVLEPGEHARWVGDGGEASATATSAQVPEPAGDFGAGWAAIRDANIRPFVEWIVPPPVSLPVLPSARGGNGNSGPQRPNPNGGGGRPQPQQQNAQQASDGNRKRRRRRRHGRQRQDEGRHERGDRGDRSERGDRNDRTRSPRLPGVYNPGGD